MMRSFFRFLVLFALLLAYGVQAIGQVQHLHVSGDRHHCTACSFSSLPGEPPASTAEPLSPDLFVHAGEIRSQVLPPPPSLRILDVSFATSPPHA